MPELAADQFLAARNVCRYCECTVKQACTIDAIPPRTCHWIDVRHTVCSAPKCMGKLRAQDKDVLRVVIRRHCICGRPKNSRVFCPACWEMLPWQIGALLHTPVSRGLAVYYTEAVAYLTAAQEADRNAKP